MCQIGQRAAVGLAAWLELRRWNEQRRHEAATQQEHAHDQRRAGEHLARVANTTARVVRCIGRISPHQRHDHHPGFKAGQPEGELGEDQEGRDEHRGDIAVGGE